MTCKWLIKILYHLRPSSSVTDEPERLDAKIAVKTRKFALICQFCGFAG